MQFVCFLCNYATNDISNFSRHKKTEKHILNEQIEKNEITQMEKKEINGEFVCEHCDKSFSSKSNLTRHQKRYCGVIAEQPTYKKMEDEIKKLQEQNEKLLDLAMENSHVAMENSKTANKSLRGITYAMKHLKNAQQLKMLKGEDAVKLLTYDNKKSKSDTVEMIIIKYKNGLLDKHLGDILVKAYKKNDPQFQSVWGVDVTRFHFILKQKEWTSDNCGIKLTELIIDPFLESVEKMVLNYCESENKNNRDISDSDSVDSYYNGEKIDEKSTFDKYTKKWGFCQNILIDISKCKLHKQILKYITPHLKLTQCDVSDKAQKNNKKTIKNVTSKKSSIDESD